MERQYGQVELLSDYNSIPIFNISREALLRKANPIGKDNPLFNPLRVIAKFPEIQGVIFLDDTYSGEVDVHVCSSLDRNGRISRRRSNLVFKSWNKYRIEQGWGENQLLTSMSWSRSIRFDDEIKSRSRGGIHLLIGAVRFL